MYELILKVYCVLSQVIRKYLTSHTAYGDTGVRDDKLQMDNVPLG